MNVFRRWCRRVAKVKPPDCDNESFNKGSTSLRGNKCTVFSYHSLSPVTSHLEDCRVRWQNTKAGKFSLGILLFIAYIYTYSFPLYKCNVPDRLAVPSPPPPPARLAGGTRSQPDLGLKHVRLVNIARAQVWPPRS
ncbi:hypothetical protein E2C01_048168 [Portunus trituberculatus]|uniref:Uncharacterized protein n=1 Tax=Portunus trituberculatus TaxID=210409 RepID=A0A5B7GAT7_PORTR|nr:hypothetical protein [Portunus trituberculatus]